jgi:hypothetical protein
MIQRMGNFVDGMTISCSFVKEFLILPCSTVIVMSRGMVEQTVAKTGFRQFAELPPEIRRKIWRHCE